VKRIVSIGSYDGFHKGHRYVIKNLLSQAYSSGLSPLVITFDRHPSYVVSSSPVRQITTLREKVRLIRGMGVDVYVLRFTKTFSFMKAEDFVKDFLIKKLDTKMIVAGYDHTIGSNHLHISEVRERFAIDVEILSPYRENGFEIKSSYIRRLLMEDGNVKLANSYLGYCYSFGGIVYKGSGIGKKLLFPTANIYILDKKKLIPREGVYAVFVLVEGIKRFFFGVMNIGRKPTFFRNRKAISLEVYILDFSLNIYGKYLRVFLVDRIRDEMKFSDVNNLKRQIFQDIEKAKVILTQEVENYTENLKLFEGIR